MDLGNKPVKTLVLPSTKGLPLEQQVSIEYYDDLQVGDFIDGDEVEAGYQRTFFYLKRLIKSWGFKVNGIPAPIDDSSLRLLKGPDYAALAGIVNEMMNRITAGTGDQDEKKA